MQSLANASKRRRTLNMNDKAQREQYVREYCDMMAVASKDVEAQKTEYQQVTMRLADLDEFEKLPVTDKSQVRIRANKVIRIEQEDSNYTRPTKKITEAQYREMERLAKEHTPKLIIARAHLFSSPLISTVPLYRVRVVKEFFEKLTLYEPLTAVP